MDDDLIQKLYEEERKQTMLYRLQCRYEERQSRYGVKKYRHKYTKRNVPIDYQNKAKFILDNLQYDHERYKTCKKIINGKTKLVAVGMSYDELDELARNINCVSIFLKSKKYQKFHDLVRDMYLGGLSNIKYGKKYNLDRGSVEHLKQKLFTAFGDFLATYDISTNTIDEIIEGDLILDPKYFESAELKMNIFEMLEEAKVLDKYVEAEMKKDWRSDLPE